MRYFLFFIIIHCTTLLNAQYSNLAEMASGQLVNFSPITEMNDDIYGYLAIYALNPKNKTQYEYEYVVLDPNLNKVANGSFIDPIYKNFSYNFFNISKHEHNILISRINYIADKPKFVFTTHHLLDLKTNTLSPNFYMDGNKIIEGHPPVKGIKKWTRNRDLFHVPRLYSEGIIQDSDTKLYDISGNAYLQNMVAFNLDFEEQWQYNYNPKADNRSHTLRNITPDELLLTVFNPKTQEYILHNVDVKSGKLNYTYAIRDQDDPYSYSFIMEKLDDRLVILGKMANHKKSGYEDEEAIGVFKIELDHAGNEISKKFVKWGEMLEHIHFKENGKLDKNYYLASRAFYVLNDGSAILLTEKAKLSYNLIYNQKILKTTDLVLLKFNPDFELVETKTIDKDKTKFYNSDYLYSQSLENGNGVAFFYQDYKEDEATQDKNWLLGILTVKGDQIYHEQIPMTSETHSISPYIAKEGYILLREVNYKEESDQVRLERLNN